MTTSAAILAHFGMAFASPASPPLLVFEKDGLLERLEDVMDSYLRDQVLIADRNIFLPPLLAEGFQATARQDRNIELLQYIAIRLPGARASGRRGGAADVSRREQTSRCLRRRRRRSQHGRLRSGCW